MLLQRKEKQQSETLQALTAKQKVLASQQAHEEAMRQSVQTLEAECKQQSEQSKQIAAEMLKLGFSQHEVSIQHTEMFAQSC